MRLISWIHPHGSETMTSSANSKISENKLQITKHQIISKIMASPHPKNKFFKLIFKVPGKIETVFLYKIVMCYASSTLGL
jgi:hypothetical protein